MDEKKQEMNELAAKACQMADEQIKLLIRRSPDVLRGTVIAAIVASALDETKYMTGDELFDLRLELIFQFKLRHLHREG